MQIDEVKEFYDNKSKYLQSYFKAKSPRLTKVLSFIDSQLSSKHLDNCLDIGCGTGITSEHLRKYAHNITAIDLSTENIKAAKEHNLYTDINYMSGDFTGVNLGKFDLVCCFDCLEHILDKKKFIKNISDHCTGTLLVSIPNPERLKQLRITNPKALQIVDNEIYDEDFKPMEIKLKKIEGEYIYYLIQSGNGSK
jgi:2-polyprenyl-3-methyl-5-hydroxy-6-metoxy-1,4-benzoquinol methylase